MEQIYREAASLRRNPEEVFGMYSEALRILDRNTVHHMIEEQNKRELEQSQNTIQEQKQRLSEQDTIEALKRQLEQLQQGNH